MTYVDTTFRVSDLLVICGALWVVGRLVARKVITAMNRIDERLTLHEQALERAGWLRRNRKGELEVSSVHQQRAGL
jgi:hypothetical protein